MTAPIMWIVLGAAAMYWTVDSAQTPCTPLDNGPYLSTKPTLSMDIFEATDSELALDPSQYRAQLRLNGQVGGQGGQGIVLEVMPDYQFLNPEDIFRFEHQSGLNYLQMYKALDRDGPTASIEDDTNTFTFTLKCSLQSNSSDYTLYDARVFVRDKNDNSPVLVNLTTTLLLSELTPANLTVLKVLAEDKDLASNLTYSIVPHMQLTDDMSHLFKIDPHNGDLSLTGQLDYETMNGPGFIQISVADDGMPARSATATLTVAVVDGDDQGPAYVYPGCWSHRGRCSWPKYTASTLLKRGQAIQVFPVPNKIQQQVAIRARDLDATASPVLFSIASTIPPGREQSFTVTSRATGTNGLYEATIIPQQDMTVEHGFEIFLQAEEQSEEKRFEIAMILFEDPAYVCKQETTGTGSSSAQTGAVTNSNNNAGSGSSSSEKYSEPIIALIVVVAILAAFMLCLALAFFFVMRTSHKRPSRFGEVNMSYTDNGNARL